MYYDFIISLPKSSRKNHLGVDLASKKVSDYDMDEKRGRYMHKFPYRLDGILSK